TNGVDKFSFNLELLNQDLYYLKLDIRNHFSIFKPSLTNNQSQLSNNKKLLANSIYFD
ncbi:MAG: hypothetical protein RLZZ94_1812, partial [Bacteroidota bacterium]